MAVIAEQRYKCFIEYNKSGVRRQVPAIALGYDRGIAVTSLQVEPSPL
jgi:hypothetical protein